MAPQAICVAIFFRCMCTNLRFSFFLNLTHTLVILIFDASSQDFAAKVGTPSYEERRGEITTNEPTTEVSAVDARQTSGETV